MRGRVTLRYRETSARTVSAKLGGTTEVCLSSLFNWDEGHFLYPFIPNHRYIIRQKEDLT